MLARLINRIRRAIYFALPFNQRPGFPCLRCWRPMSHYRNVDKNHWGVCLRCKVTWLIGRNLFSSWKEENQQTWESNNAYLSQFKDITQEVYR